MDHNTFINSCSKRRAFESLRYHSVRPFNVLAGAELLATSAGVAYGFLVGFYHGTVNCIRNTFPRMFYKSVDGKIVIITGGGGGLGRLMALKLADLGAVIVSLDINEEGNLETQTEVEQRGGKCHVYKCDLTDREDVYAVADRVKAEVGTVDVLINNAGIVSGSYFLDTPDKKIELTFKVNALAHFWTIKAFLGDMMARRSGHIVSVASAGGYTGMYKLADYCSSKFAAVGLHESLQNELDMMGFSRDEIAMTIVAPFFMSTDMFKGVQGRHVQGPDSVASRIVHAIRLNQEMVVAPWWSAWCYVIKQILPYKGAVILAKAFGVHKAMDNFTGKQDRNVEVKSG